MGANDDPYNTRELTPAELVSMGLMPAGPLAPAIQSKDPEQNMANIREMINPPPQPVQAPPTFDPFNNPQSPLPFSGGKAAPLLERLGAALPMATAGFGAPSFLGKLGVGEKIAPFLERRAMDLGVGAGSEELKGSSPEEAAKTGGLTALAGGVLEGAGKGVGYLGSAVSKKVFDTAQEAKVMDWLKQRVPWWKDFDVSEMATSGKAKDALHKGYEEAFTTARDQIPETEIAKIPVDIANALKIKGEGGMDSRFLTANNRDMIQRFKDQAAKTGAEAVDMVSVNARELLDKLPGSKGKIRAQIMKGLDPVAGNVIPEAREAYRVGQGWQELANKGGIGKEGRFDAQTAQEALRKSTGEQSLAQKALQPRGMNELEDIIKGPLQKPITSVTPNSLAWHLGLGGAGLLGGLGLHGLRGMAGGAAAMIPRPTFYKNVPPAFPQAGPLAEQGLRAVMPGFLQNMKSSEQE